MTLTEFSATRRWVADLGAETSIDEYNGKEGFIFAAGFVLVKRHGLYHDETADIWVTYDRAIARLYDHAQSEGLV